jgi:hypothetical protein
VTGPPPVAPVVFHHQRPRPEARPAVDAEAVRAAEQLRLALHITGDKLKVARREVREALTVPQS